MRFGVRRVRFVDSREESQLDDSSPAVVRDPSKCILCGDCVRVCGETIGMGIIDFASGAIICASPPPSTAPCPRPTASAADSAPPSAPPAPSRSITRSARPGGPSTTQGPHRGPDAPAVRVAVGEAFGLPAGSNALDQLVTALKYMGVDEIYDTTFAADFTTIEESREFLARLENGGPFPMFTSCCPAWVKYVEEERSHFLKNISTCKSPMEMFAAVLKDQYAEKDAEDGRTTYHIASCPAPPRRWRPSGRSSSMTENRTWIWC